MTFITTVRRPHRERELSLPWRYSEVLYPAWSSTGMLALTLGGVAAEEIGTGHIATVAPSGKGLRLVTRSLRDSFPDWSPKADRVVFQRVKETGRAFGGDVLVVPARSHSRRRPRRLTQTRDAYSPVWSPDGGRIAYLRVRNAMGNTIGSLWTMRAADGGRQRLVATGVFDDRISWQPRPRRR